jgi:16S rRNA (cytosine967-C5)-methyltransferase
VVDKSTAESVLSGADVYAPGIVGCEGLKRHEEVGIVDVNGRLVGGGYSMMGEAQVLKVRKGLAVKITRRVYNVPSLRETDEFNQGLIYLQSFPAILAARNLDPKPGEIIVDLNCAPGGKLSHISQLMGNSGLIVGVDRRGPKISTVRETIRRLGCRNVNLIKHDARYLDVDFPSLKADRCLVDPPCSALGVTPKVYERRSEEEIEALSAYQKQFLTVASNIVKKGGVIVYSVCTVTLEECEEVAKFGVDECGLELEEQPFFFGSSGVGFTYQEVFSVQRFHPHIHGSGFFIARFRKV